MDREGEILRNFMRGFTAATELYGRTGKTGSFIEAVILGAALVDGALRIGLILKDQLDTQSSRLLVDFLYQGKDDQPILEREIYKRASAAGVIDQELLEKLNVLYDERNRVVHRYIVSEITTEEVLDIAIRYEHIFGIVGLKIGELEGAQIRENVGMVRRDETRLELRDLLDFADEKHGGKVFAAQLRERHHK